MLPAPETAAGRCPRGMSGLWRPRRPADRCLGPCLPGPTQKHMEAPKLHRTPAELLAVTSGRFSMAQARRIVGEHFRPRPAIYWTDLLVTWILGIAAYRFVREEWLGLGVRLALFAISCLAIYRAGLFIHELVHLSADRFRGFRIVWNVLCGIPFLIPSFVYYTHLDHHRRRHYGTRDDGEYLPLAHRSRWWIVGYLAQSIIIPLLAVIRFGILTPLTWMHPAIRRWVHRHASSMIIDPTYLRPLPTARVLWIIRLQEVGCFLFIVTFATLILLGRQPLFVLYQAYATGVVVVTINAVRTLAAHRWLGDGESMTFLEQLVDSVNVPADKWWNILWAPVGLRFHALHHLFPTLPYHALSKAHRRLMAELPADSPYRVTESASLGAALVSLWRRAGAPCTTLADSVDLPKAASLAVARPHETASSR
jgi:fatty acid desaturase